MTDLEMTRLCAEAMGYKEAHDYESDELPRGSILCVHLPQYHFLYNPLHDDAQAMALVKRFEVELIRWDENAGWVAQCFNSTIRFHSRAWHESDLNRAIVECVAKMQQSKFDNTRREA